jgi:hypothetical protein
MRATAPVFLALVAVAGGYDGWGEWFRMFFGPDSFVWG